MTTTTFRTGYGADWLDLTATLPGRYQPLPDEQVPDPGSLRVWLRERSLEPTTVIAKADVEEFHLLREAMHGAAAAIVRGDIPLKGDVLVLDRALAGDQPVGLRRGADGLRVSRPTTPAVARARLARQAVSDLCGPHRLLLKACDDDTCSGIFVDHSGKRRWCADERCGVRARVRAHRARARGTA